MSLLTISVQTGTLHTRVKEHIETVHDYNIYNKSTMQQLENQEYVKSQLLFIDSSQSCYSREKCY